MITNKLLLTMKIKELHLRNIASIEKADIDFESALNDKITDAPASIFLISGDTGTGKSVILDAIAMALYKKTPRIVGVSTKKENEFVNERGESVSMHSIEQYTRLGISVQDECYSEVVFEGNDGREYHARLELGMAKTREKDENGNYILKYKSPKWLFKVDTEDWDSVDKKTGQPILDAVGLTFEQFGRMAMLAQGQFAAFLTGDKTERESILEQLTNTAHFSKYGMAINRLFKRAEDGKKQAQSTYDAECGHTLSEDTVLEYRTRLAALEAEEKVLSAQISVADNRLQQIEKFHQNNNVRSKLLEQKLRLESETQSDEYKDRLMLVNDWDATVTQRQRIQDRKEAEKQLAMAQAEEEREKEKFSLLSSDLKAREDAIIRQRAAIAKERLWLDQRANRDTLYTTLGETRLQAEQLQQQLKEQKEKEKHLKREKEKSTDLRQNAETLKAEAQKACSSAEEHRSALDATLREQKEMNPEEVNRKMLSVAQELNALQNLKERIERLLAEVNKLAAAQTEIEKDTRGLETLKTRMNDACKSFENARKSAEEAKARLITMGESLNETLVNLRRRLVAEQEEHCPLCGQRLESICGEEDFRGILTPIEQEQQRLAQECNRCEEEYNKAKSRYDSDAGALAARAKQLAQNLAAVDKEKSAIKRNLAEKDIDTGVEFLPAQHLSAVDALIGRKESERKTLGQQQELLNELQKKLNTQLARQKQLDEEKAKAERQLTRAENGLNKNTEDTRRLAQELEDAGVKVRQLSATLAGKLDSFYPDWQTQMENTLVALTADAQEYTQKKAAVDGEERTVENAQNVADTLRAHHTFLLTEYPECALSPAAQPFKCRDIQSEWTQLIGKVKSLKENIRISTQRIASCNETLAAYYAAAQRDEAYLLSISNRENELAEARQHITATNEQIRSHTDAIKAAEQQIAEALEALGIADATDMPDKEELQNARNETNARKEELIGQKGAIRQSLQENDKNIEKRNKAAQELEEAKKLYNKWDTLNRHFGGTRFRTLVQTYVLRPLLNNANIYLEQITDRYKLTCSEDNSQLSILVHDLYNKGNVRSSTILSGGERFMISLALSLALSSLNRPDMNINILFIDEGFGTLDEKSLDSVMSTLEKLQEIAGQSNRRVGIISHREELNERIPVQIQVKRRGEGRSIVEIING